MNASFGRIKGDGQRKCLDVMLGDLRRELRFRLLARFPASSGAGRNHPHGGGEGRNKGRHPVTPWGKPTKGYKTRGKKSSDRLIVSRRRK